MIRTLQALSSGSDPYGSFIIAVYIVTGFIYLLLVTVPAIAQYVITSLGLHKLGQKHGVARAGVAWLPIGDMYVLGSLADTAADHNGADKPGYRKRLVGLTIPIAAISAVMTLSVLFVLLVALVMGLAGILPSTFDEMVIIPLVICYGGFIPLLILGIKCAICMYKGLWQIYRMYSKNLAITYLLLSIFVPFSMGIIMLSLVSKTPTEPAKPEADDTMYTAEPIDPTIYTA